jgi:hypothetical protein
MAMQNHNTQNSGRIMDSLKAAKDEGALNQKDFGDLVKDHLQQQIDGGITKRAQLEEQRSASSTPLTKAVVDAAGHGRSVKAQTMDGEGGSESVSIDAGGEAGEHQVLAEATGVQSVAQPNSRTCWAAVSSMMCMWRDPEQFQSIDDVMVAAGDKFVQLYNKGRGNGRGLPMSDKREFLTALEMVSEPGGASYPLQSYVDWLNDYGPLWITIDAEPDPDEFARHAIIVIRISGTGTPDGVGTDVTYIDPIGAKTRTVAFSEFNADYESLANFQKDSPPSIQVVHFKDVANDSGEGGGKGAAGVAGAAAAVGEKALDTAFDVVGEYLKAELAAGSGTAQLPSNMMFPIDRTKADDYGTGGPMQDAIRQCRITFENLAGTGPGDGLEGYVTLQWFSTNYLGPIASKTKRSTVRHLRSIKFAQAITGTGFLIVGGALISADVDVSLFPLKVESKVAGSYQPIAVQIKIAAKAKTAAGDSVMMTKVVMLHPEDPVNYKLVYVRNPRKDVRVEVDATP